MTECKTWKIDFETNRLIGFIDQKELLKQHIFFILNIKKFETPIYSYNLGMDFNQLFKSLSNDIPNILFSNIKDALLSDYRINDIIDFSCKVFSSYILAEFTVVSIYGNMSIKNTFKEVS